MSVKNNDSHFQIVGWKISLDTGSPGDRKSRMRLQLATILIPWKYLLKLFIGNTPPIIQFLVFYRSIFVKLIHGLWFFSRPNQCWATATALYRISHISHVFQDIEKYRNRIFFAIFCDIFWVILVFFGPVRCEKSPRDRNREVH